MINTVDKDLHLLSNIPVLPALLDARVEEFRQVPLSTLMTTAGGCSMFMMFEKTGGPGIESYAFGGHNTVYQYSAYGPETNRIRPRISQMFIFKLVTNKINPHAC